MKVLPLVVVPELPSTWNETIGSDGDFIYAINTDKLILVLSITFGFILLLLLSLLCIFYFMGFMQNQFGWTWGHPHNELRHTSAEPYANGINGIHYGGHPPCYGNAHHC